MDKIVRDQLMVELIAGLECTSLQRRSGLRGGQTPPADYPIKFLHCLPDSVQTQYREEAETILMQARELGPIGWEDITEEGALTLPYDEWVLQEARAVLGEMGTI